MNITIYGKDDCSFCKRAVALSDQLIERGLAASHKYVNIVEEGIDAAGLADIMGKVVRTVPQILVDGKPLGGYTELAALADTL